MLESRQISTPGTLQPMMSVVYTSRILVMRKRLVPTKDEFSGDLGENPIQYFQAARGWPALITSQATELEFLLAGQTDRGDFTLTCPWKKMSDGKLLIRERDIIIDMESKVRFLVLWSYDPMNAHTQIRAALQSGVVNDDLETQG